jgi:uncharacterized protein YdeI (YjbR/CyaY-like superfamily)
MRWTFHFSRDAAPRTDRTVQIRLQSWYREDSIAPRCREQKQMNPKVDTFLENAGKWREEMEKLRSIALDCGLGEELKWRKPCYTFGQGNVAIIQPFKEKCAFMFFKGALLEDADGLLERPGENSHAARRMMFSSVGEVIEMEDRLRAFIADAIEVEKAGLQVEAKKSPEPLPEELDAMFAEVSGLKKAFEALTPGRQRAYVLQFSGAKQSKTRRSRIERCVPRILAGKGLRD